MRRQARQSLRTAAVTLITVLLLQGSAYALEPQPAHSGFVDYAAAGFDLVILRPLGLAALIVGSVALFPAAVMSLAGGEDATQTAVDLFVVDPWRDVFQRPLGDF